MCWSLNKPIRYRGRLTRDTAEAIRLCAVLSFSFPSMACRDSRRGFILTSVGLLVFVMSLCNCAKLTRLKGLDTSRETAAHTKNQPERGHLLHGKLLIGQNYLKAAKLNGTNATDVELDVEADYQADMGRCWRT